MSLEGSYTTEIKIPQTQMTSQAANIMETPSMDILRLAMSKVIKDRDGRVDNTYTDNEGRTINCVIAVRTGDFLRGVGAVVENDGRVTFRFDAYGDSAGIGREICDVINQNYVIIAVMRAQKRLGFNVAVQERRGPLKAANGMIKFLIMFMLAWSVGGCAPSLPGSWSPVNTVSSRAVCLMRSELMASVNQEGALITQNLYFYLNASPRPSYQVSEGRYLLDDKGEEIGKVQRTVERSPGFHASSYSFVMPKGANSLSRYRVVAELRIDDQIDTIENEFTPELLLGKKESKSQAGAH